MSYGWVAAGIAALVAGGTTYYNNTNLANQQDRELAANLRQQGDLQQQATQKTNQLIQQTADSSPATAKQSLLQQYTNELQRKKASSTNGLAQVGNVSSAYTKAANDAASGISTYGNTTADLLSSIDAPALQRQGEAANLSSFGSQLGQIKANSQADNYLSQMRLQGLHLNPWLQGLSSAAQSFATKGFSGASGFGSGTGTDGGGSIYNNNGYGTNLPY
jgi:hypothetical protein